MSIIKKVKKFFGYSGGKQREKREKLEAMIEKLVVKAERLLRRHEQESGEKKKKRLLKEYKAVKKIIQKSRQKLEALSED